MKLNRLLRFCMLVAPLLLAACATGTDPRDPWEAMNRKTFAFNDAIDRHVLKPVAQGYKNVAPVFVQARVNDFFDNIYDIETTLNQVLQGKLPDGINDFGRFVVNTTFGGLGFWDVASGLGLEKHHEDFGQTLAVWGVPSGPYFVIPFFGPSTVRDAPAKLVDPKWYYARVLDDDPLYWSLWTLDVVRDRANLLGAETLVEQAALDRYSFIRDAWMQRRISQIYDGNPPPLKEEE